MTNVVEKPEKGGLESAAQTRLADLKRCARCAQQTSDRIGKLAPQVRARVFHGFHDIWLLGICLEIHCLWNTTSKTGRTSWFQSFRWVCGQAKFHQDWGPTCDRFRISSCNDFYGHFDTRHSSLNSALLLWWQWKPVRMEDHLDWWHFLSWCF